MVGDPASARGTAASVASQGPVRGGDEGAEAGVGGRPGSRAPPRRRAGPFGPSFGVREDGISATRPAT